MHWALLGDAGHCEGVLTMEGGIPDDPRAAPISPAEAAVLRALGHHAVCCAGRWGILPESHGRKIDRGRGLRADYAAQWTRRKMATLAALGTHPLEVLRDDDPRCPVPAPTPWPGLAYSLGDGGMIPIREDLVMRHMTEGDLTPLSQLMDASGAYEGWTLRQCWTQAHVWWQDARVWALVLEWQPTRQALQYELLHFDDRRGSVRGGFVTHVSRERPTWFWREVSRPLFERLLALGVARMSGHVRADRKDWAESLTATYGAENLGLVNGFWTLRYDLSRMVAQATGWRVPETAGPWWAQEGGVDGDYAVLETGAGAVEASLERVRAAWGGRPRGRYAEAMVRERVALDAGTLLQGTVGGQLRTVWVMRWKAPGVINWAVATPWDPSEANGRLYRLATRWCQAAGAQTIQVLLTEAQWVHPAMATQRARMGWTERGRVTNELGGFVDATADIATLLARPDAAWVATG